MKTTTANKLAQTIVDDLYTNGQGDEADRLVLMSKAGQDLGGWGKLPLYHRLAQLLERWNPDTCGGSQSNE
jgi:hypothetical protein